MNETYVIHITQKCNMNCSYCYEKDKISEYDWEEIKSSINDIFAYIGLNIVRIEFLGGEPMLRFDLIEKSYEYIQTNWKNSVYNYCITTNGSILNKSILEFLSKNKNIDYTISIDGVKFSNQLRLIGDINAYDIVVKNIFEILKYDSEINLSAHIVTHPYNIFWMLENISHIYSLGIKEIRIGTIENTMIIDEEFCNIFKKEIKEVSNFAINHKDLTINLFSAIKPKTDVRKYIKDASGKTLFESYGRISDDITSKSSNKYNIIECYNSPVSDMIYDIRKFSFDYHQKNLNIYD